jgi:hypothetical protein
MTEETPNSIVKVDEKKEKIDLILKGEVINLVRTVQRNYINLTNIADNKANILISINSLMLTILLPICFTNFEFIKEYGLYIPMSVFALTCLITIVLASLVISPFRKTSNGKNPKETEKERSPFFFAGYADLSFLDYENLFKKTISSKKTLSNIIAKDLYQFGITLAAKYKMIKISYTVFYTGMIFSFLSFALFLYFKS